jgi:RNA polymerase sigma factor (sigma-70 family)
VSDPDDQVLIQAMIGGDPAALRALMQRYDRLVRYAIFRACRTHCLRDPDWLDLIAQDTWTGFVRSMQRATGPLPRDLATYLLQTARNRSISAMRSARPASEEADPPDVPVGGEVAASGPSAPEVLSRVEELVRLRSCVERLPEADHLVCGQLVAIMGRKWQEAAAALGMPESTIRSRWKNILSALRSCMEGQGSVHPFAPSGGGGDS